MSTPLFIRDPRTRSNTYTYLGGSVDAIIVSAGTEPILIEELVAAFYGGETEEGIIAVYLQTESDTRLLMTHSVDAASDGLVNERFRLDVVLEPGMTLRVNHSINVYGVGGAEVTFTAIGGVLR